MEATALLKAQHEEMKELFEYFNGANDRGTKIRIFVRLADKLTAHAAMEEALFYPLVRAADDSDETEKATEEHEVMRRLVSDLLDMRLTDPQFKTRFKLLRERVLQHVVEEERVLFARARARLSGEELHALGEKMEALFDEVLAGGGALREAPESRGETAFA